MDIESIENQPLVSVYLPTRDRPLLLDRALASIASQTYKKIQVIVCDDASESSLSNIQQKYAASFYELIWIRNNEAKGACAARNIAIEASTGDYVTGLDDDDVFLPERIEKFVECIKATKCSFVCSNYFYVISQHRVVIQTRRRCGKVTFEELKSGNIVGNQIFIRRDVLGRSSKFDTTFKSWQDYDLWFRLVRDYGDAYRLQDSTMLVYADSAKNRITGSSCVGDGFSSFVVKHESYLSSGNLLELKIADLENRGEKVRIGLILRLFRARKIRQSFSLLFKYHIVGMRWLFFMLHKRKAGCSADIIF